MDTLPTDRDRGNRPESGLAEAVDAQFLGMETLVRRLRSELAAATRGLPDAKTEQITELTELLSAAALHTARSAADAADVVSAQRNSPRLFELDALTELPNRALFRDRFAQALAHARRRSSRIGLLFIDLDEFKSINDRYGHTVGDHVLRLVARRLAAAVRDGDTVSRHGGDEFLVLLSEVSDAADVATLAGVVRRALSGALRVGEDVIEIGASIGVSVFPEDGEDQDTLVQRADEAMFNAKRRRRGGEVGSFVDSTSVDARAEHTSALAPSFTELALREAEHRIQALRLSNEELLLSALVAADLQQRAERAAAEQAELLSVGAHELRGSLFAMQSAVQTLVLTEGDPAHLPRLTLVLQRQIANISRITGDLLDVARLNSGRLALEYAPINACQMVVDTVAEWPRHLGTTTIEMDDVPVEPGAVILADAARIRQVLIASLTLLSNRDPAPLRIRVSVRRVNSQCRIMLVASGTAQSAHSTAGDDVDVVLRAASPMRSGRITPKLSLVLIRQLLKAHDGALKFSRDVSTGGLSCVLELPTLHAASSRTTDRHEI